MKQLFALILTVLLCLPAGGATIVSTDSGSTAVQTAINAASGGDTVIITNRPALTNWTSGVTVTGKGIQIQGLGLVWITNLTGSGTMFDIGGDNNNSPRLSGIRCDDRTGSGTFVRFSGDGKDFLCDFNWFRSPDFQMAEQVLVIRNKGVIWSNIFELTSVTFGSGTLHLLGSTSLSNSWFSDDTMGMLDLGGTNNVYIENNIFSNSISQCVDVDNNVRAVIRNNVLYDSQLTIHGSDTSTYGGRHTEVYSNVFQWSGTIAYPINHWLLIRGGSGLFMGNVVPDINNSQWGDKAEVTLNAWQVQENAGPHPCRTPADYPWLGITGGGWHSGALSTEKWYFWNNTGSAQFTTGKNPYNGNFVNSPPSQCATYYTTADVIQQNRDWAYGAKPNWAPYNYPHPLRPGVNTNGSIVYPVVNSVAVAANGTTWTINTSTNVSFGAGGSGGFALSINGPTITLTYTSGTGSSNLVYTGSRPILNTQFGTLAYTQPGAGWQNAAAQDMQSFSSKAFSNGVTTNSGPRNLRLHAP